VLAGAGRVDRGRFGVWRGVTVQGVEAGPCGNQPEGEAEFEGPRSGKK
jgi:hypothetical protein